MFALSFGRRARQVALLALVVPTTAHAQLGGLIKRAIGEKVAEKATEKVTEKDPRADSASTHGRGGRAGRMRASGAPMASIQLTADTLDHALRGLDVLARGLSRRDSLGVIADALGGRLSELSTANGDLSRTFHEKANAIHSCRQDVFTAIANKRGQDLQTRLAADPTLQRKYAEGYARYASAASDAAAKGDTARLQKLQLEYYRSVLGPGFSSRQDTVAANAKCGTELPMPATLVREDSLRRESQRVTEARRDAEISARTDAIAQSGLPAEKFDAARERIEMWYRGRKSGRITGYASFEEDGLAAQLPRIERIMRALGVEG